MELVDRCKRVKLLLLDVDGVLTDGRLYFGPTGEVLKGFYVRDGQGLKIGIRPDCVRELSRVESPIS